MSTTTKLTHSFHWTHSTSLKHWETPGLWFVVSDCHRLPKMLDTSRLIGWNQWLTAVRSPQNEVYWNAARCVATRVSLANTHCTKKEKRWKEEEEVGHTQLQVKNIAKARFNCYTIGGNMGTKLMASALFMSPAHPPQPHKSSRHSTHLTQQFTKKWRSSPALQHQAGEEVSSP